MKTKHIIGYLLILLILSPIAFATIDKFGIVDVLLTIGITGLILALVILIVYLFTS